MKYAADEIDPHPPMGARPNCQFERRDGSLCGHNDRWHHLAMLSTPDDWPQWPILPMKRWVGPGPSLDDLEVGIVILGIPTEVRIGNMLEAANLATMPRHSYDSIEALVDDGWVVD